ncbi:hypothetical protein FGIG_11506 [Fasciola gigantica]|uniref:Mitochondrial inner membrane protein Mpv17 n=1 Tax=Fasciola gigantica TaxID=46835 RepID=A0A504YKW8_FASGI|nr:hypothetical protein FGIG_11506 [Fasciola gigantica]
MTLMAAGDTLSQKVIERRPDFDFNRNKNFWIVGGCFLGPVLSKWNYFISWYFVGTPRIKALKMLFADQVIITPVRLIFSIVSLLALLRDPSGKQCKIQVRENFPEILYNNYKIWPAAQWINFSFVPLPFRVLYINSIALFWNIYVSYATQKSTATRLTTVVE